MPCPMEHEPEEEDDDDDEPERRDIPVIIPERKRKAQPGKPMSAIEQAEAVVSAIEVINVVATPTPVPTGGTGARRPATGGTGSAAPAFVPPPVTAPPAAPPFDAGDSGLGGAAGSTDPGFFPGEPPGPTRGRGEPGFFPGEPTNILGPLIFAAFVTAVKIFRNVGPPPVRAAFALAPLLLPTLENLEKAFTQTLGFRLGRAPDPTPQGFAGFGFLKDMSQMFVPPPGEPEGGDIAGPTLEE